VQDYVQAIASAKVVVFPEKGGAGPKHRVLQAMSLGKTVVGSPDAFQGIKVQDRVDCCICRNPGDFVESITRLLRDEGLQQRFGRSATPHPEQPHHGYAWTPLGPFVSAGRREIPARSDTTPRSWPHAACPWLGLATCM